MIIPALNEERSIAHVVDGLLELQVCGHCHAITAITQDTHHFIPGSDSSGRVAQYLSPFAEYCRCTAATENATLVDQVIVGDNGSTDQTAEIARDCGALVAQEPEKGYGAACLAALSTPLAHGRKPKDLIVFVDGDDSVIAEELPLLLKPLVDGADLVIGSRTRGHCEKGALSIPQIIGNRMASTIMRLLWRHNVTDLGPFRAITQEALDTIQMRDRQFGWTVEMQVRALQLSLTTIEVPVSTRRRIGPSKISGTLRGIVAAAQGILGTIWVLYWRQQKEKVSRTQTSDTLAVPTPSSVNTSHKRGS